MPWPEAGWMGAGRHLPFIKEAPGLLGKPSLPARAQLVIQAHGEEDADHGGVQTCPAGP